VRELDEDTAMTHRQTASQTTTRDIWTELRALRDMVVDQRVQLRYTWEQVDELKGEQRATQTELCATQTELCATQTEPYATQTELCATQAEPYATQTEPYATQTELCATN
jgi:hypothetical protein